MATIKDVAKLAGVSPSTVSRVIADSPRISQATKDRVRSAMRSLDYQPNALARGLVRQKSQTIGLIMSRSTEAALSNPFFPEVIRGISSVAQKVEYNLLLSTSADARSEQDECLRLLNHRQVDGVILLASRRTDTLIDQLRSEGRPFVVVGRVPGADDVTWVNNDNVKAAKAATRHLIALGHRRIGFIGGPGEFVVSEDRLTGYYEALEESGLPRNPSLVRETDFSLEAGVEAAADLMNSEPEMSAVFAVDDVLALGAYRAARAAGRRIPRDLAVVGFNDDPICEHVVPALTTVRIPIYEMGKHAARLLINQLESEEAGPQSVTLNAELIVRESTGVSPVSSGDAQ